MLFHATCLVLGVVDPLYGVEELRNGGTMSLTHTLEAIRKKEQRRLREVLSKAEGKNPDVTYWEHQIVSKP